MLMRILHIGICSLLLMGNVQALDSLDILPETNSQQSTAVLNNTLRQQQNAINAVGSYFNSNGYLEVTSGGTGASGLTGLIKGNGTSAMTAITIPADATKFLDGTGAFSSLPVDKNTGNIVFEWHGAVEGTSGSENEGEYVGSSFVPAAPTANYRFIYALGNNTHNIFTDKFTKVAGVSTVTVYGRIWTRAGSIQARLAANIGGQTGTVDGTVGTHTPEWKAFTVDVSSLTNNTVYDVTLTLTEAASTNTEIYCSDIIGFGS